MRAPALHLATPEDAAALPTVAERVRALQAQARSLARDHTAAFAEKLAELQAMAVEINQGGDAFPGGVRGVAREVAMHAESRGQILATLNGRN